MAGQDYKVLVNMSTLMLGGGLQVAAAFIAHALEDPEADQWLFLISAGAARELPGFGIDPVPPRFHIFDRSPARNADARKRLLKIEKAYQPDLVFTLFGPAYVRFRSRHLCGVADPWVTHSNMLAFKNLGVKATAKALALMVWKAAWWKTVDFWWTEAQIAKDGLVSRMHCDPERIFIIPNTTGPQFSGRHYNPHPPASGECLHILCLSAYYHHKNLELIPDVAAEIKRLRPNLDFQFTVTLPEEWPSVKAIMAEAAKLQVSEHIVNLGKVPVSDTPALYERSQLCFMPSVLEVFSAVYPESLCTGVPLVTTDLRFARDVCEDAAAYFEPTNPTSAAEKIISLAENPEQWVEMSGRGQEIFSRLPNAAEKWELQKGMIGEVAHRPL